MRMRFLAPPLLVTAFLAVACTPAEDTSADAEAGDTMIAAAADAPAQVDRATVTAMVEEFDRAANAGDVDGLMASFVDDPVSLPPEQPAVEGQAAVRAFWAEFLAQEDLEVDNQLTEYWTSGDLLVARGTYTTSLTAEGEPVEIAGKWVAWFQRAADGEWKTVGNAWSTDNPPPGAGG